MSLHRPSLVFLLRVADALRRRYFFSKFILQSRVFNKNLEMGCENSFHVPVRADGEGTLRIGNRNSFGYRQAPRLADGAILLQARSRESIIFMGSNNYVSNNVSLIAASSISIGSNCLLGDFVAVYDTDFHEISPTFRRASSGTCESVTIGDNVWLGSRVMVLKGVSIGDNSVIGAMSVVTKAIPSNCIAAGVPAKVLRRFE